jgi:dynein heavy chain, axonemal
LWEKQQLLRNAIESVAKLNRELTKTKDHKEHLEKEYQECSVQLERAK